MSFSAPAAMSAPLRFQALRGIGIPGEGRFSFAPGFLALFYFVFLDSSSWLADQWQNKLIALGESDPGGCAACSIQKHTEIAYRNGLLFAS
jgi:hypothetical protein